MFSVEMTTELDNKHAGHGEAPGLALSSPGGSIEAAQWMGVIHKTTSTQPTSFPYL